MSEHPYRGQRVALLTQHGKQTLLQDPLQQALGCQLLHTDGYDTDQLGTFTRDIARAGNCARQRRAGLQARAVVWRYPDGSCGDGSCGGDEAPTPDRGAICSLDCGAQPEHSARDELSNSWHVGAVAADKLWPETRGEGIHVAVHDRRITGPRGFADLLAEIHFGTNLGEQQPGWAHD